MDRNYKERPGQKARPKSLSARRAWIEMCYLDNIEITEAVALRKESVDRNLYYGDTLTFSDGRSPQGERG